MVKITDAEFLDYVKYVNKNYGIDLSKKKMLIEGRLSNLIEKKGMNSFYQYLKSVKNNDEEEAMLINKLTTNYTYFYREEKHFQYLRETILPHEEKHNNAKILHIWSAGCSSGEEPYTIAMILDDYFKFRIKQWKIYIYATDISENVLSKAREGTYSKDSISKLPDSYIKRYFIKLSDNEYQVIPEIKDLVKFKVFNLMDPILERNRYHVIFLRNVMIYFDMETKNKIINKLYDATRTGGYLMIGHAETIQRTQSKYIYIRPAIYKKE